ncbi:MAG: signal peptidase I [Candidatus Schekmanbacteria bacterium]|nr:signal peptidase I [Candidatus Schekmanbacteria bacterium]
MSATETWPQRLLQTLREVAATCMAVLLFITFVAQPYRVDGASMLPTLEDHEMLLVNKLLYRFEDISRGDIVVFASPGNPEKMFIKRIIAVPGDVVALDHGTVILNGAALPEPYLEATMRGADTVPPRLIPDDYYYVLGDHRTRSSDSRAWGLVPVDFIKGKAFLKYWPPTHAGGVS